MQEFLLNDKVITELHMKSIDIKQQTKYVKKYDISPQSPNRKHQSIDITNLLNKKKIVFDYAKINNDISTGQNSKKTKNLFTALNTGNLQKQNQNRSLVIKEDCFTINGLKKSIKQLNDSKKIMMQRTCSLVSFNRNKTDQRAIYDFNVDIKFKRSPRCFISPSVKRQNKKYEENKQNITLQDNNQSKHKFSKQNEQKMTIKQIIDKQFEDQIRKRKALCKTAPTTHSKKQIDKLRLIQQALSDDQIRRAEGKIYNQMRQTRQKALKKNNQVYSVNIQRNKPFTLTEINKNTIKLLKKYKFDNMVYFNKFIAKD